MNIYINDVDFGKGFSVQRYWSFPSTWDKDKRRAELNSILYSDNYIASRKQDGYWERFIKDDNGDLYLCPRNLGVDGLINKIDWVPHLHDFFNALPNNTVLIGEVYLEGKTSRHITSILGCLRDKAIERQKKDKLRFYIFDILAYNGELLYTKPIQERVAFLYNKISHFPHPYVDIAEYWDTPDEIHEHWLDILAAGGEGVVLTQKNYPYEFGKRTARKTLKLKKELEDEIAVVITGRWKEPLREYTGKYIESHPYWENISTGEKVYGTMSTIVDIDRYTPITKGRYHGWAGSIQVGVLSKSGEIVPIGYLSGLTEEVKEKIVTNNELYKGRVADIQCMEIDYSGTVPTLRHARFMGFRDDLTIEDATWEKAFGTE